jgi:hypothetical protein
MQCRFRSYKKPGMLNSGIMKANVSRSTLSAAYAIAICADLLQICLFPIFSEGFLDPLDDISDVVVCAILTRLIGFHIAFLPSFLMKVIPGVTMAPTWTLAVLIATRNYRAPVIDVPSEVKPDVVVNEEQPPKILPNK